MPAGGFIDYTGKNVLVTGGSSGVGASLVDLLASLGATVTVLDRQEPPAEIQSSVSAFIKADLSDRASVDAAIEQAPDRLDVLVNNAGVLSPRRQLTADGLEATFAVNHLGPFLLTSLLRGLLERSAPARVVTLSSAAHKQVRAIAWEDVPRGGRPGPGQAYPVSKLLNILFTAELARRLAGTGVTANCLHPGFVRTGLGRDVTGVLGAVLPLILRLRPGPEAGARTPVYLASSPEVAGVTGGYFVNRRPAEPSALAKDSQAAARLWALSEDLTGLGTA
jgi:NAD(P)-dependent dehydrogenase (short-subunit alcohol dehydrogenase family)